MERNRKTGNRPYILTKRGKRGCERDVFEGLRFLWENNMICHRYMEE